MTDQVPEEVFVLRVEENVEGVARFLDAIGIVPEALTQLSTLINSTPIGDTGVFANRGAELAKALAAGYQANVRGLLQAGITPADFALQVAGGEQFRRTLEGQANAAQTYARALSAVNEVVARSRSLGLDISRLATPGGPIGGLSIPQAQRQAIDQGDRTSRSIDRLEGVLGRLERGGGPQEKVRLFRGESGDALPASAAGKIDPRGRFFTTSLDEAKQYAKESGRIVSVEVTRAAFEEAKRAAQTNLGRSGGAHPVTSVFGNEQGILTSADARRARPLSASEIASQLGTLSGALSEFAGLGDAPKVPRGATGAVPLAQRLRGQGLSDDEVTSALTNLGFTKKQAAQQLAQADQAATTSVRALAQAVDQLGTEATQAVQQLRRPFVAGGAGIALPGSGDNLPVPTGETLAEQRLRLGRSSRAIEGEFPRDDINAQRSLNRAREEAGRALAAELFSARRAITAGGAGSAPLVPFAGSFGGGFPNGPFGRPPFGGGGGGGFNSRGFDFDDLDDRASFRNASRRRAREAFNATDPGFESQINEEAERRRAQREADDFRFTRQQQARNRAESDARREDRSRRIRQEPFGASIRDSFTGPNGESFGDQFKSGFLGGRGGGSADLGLQLGQTAKFSLLYGAAYSVLFQLSQGFAMATGEALKYEDALQSLNIITGQTRRENAGLADQLGEVAVSSGLSPSAGVEAGARAIGQFDAAGADRDTQERTALLSAGVSTRIARIGNAQIEDVQAQLAGLARSLGVGIDGLSGLEDELTLIGRRTGRSSAELLGAAAGVGTLAVGAGFTPEELFAVIGRVSSTTGSPQSAAGAFRQVLSRADDPNFQGKVEAEFGIEAVGQSLRDIFANFAATAPDSEEINRFSLLFGRGASQQVSQIIARDFTQIQGLAGEAGAARGSGLGQDTFEKVMQSIGSQLKLMGANFLELGKDLAETGIFDALYVLILTLNETLEAVDSVVDAFNSIPRPIRSAAFALTEIYLALNLVSKFGGPAAGIISRLGASLATAAATNVGDVGSLVGGLGRRRDRSFTDDDGVLNLFPDADGVFGGDRNGVRDRLRNRRGLGAGSIDLDSLLATRAGRVAPTFARGLAGLSAFTGLGAGGLALAGGAALAAGVGVVQTIREGKDVDRAATGAASAAAAAESVTELRDAAARAAEAIKKGEEANSFNLFSKDILTAGFGTIANVTGLTGVNDDIARARTTQASAEEQARALEAAEKEARKAAPASSFGDFSVGSVNQGLKDLTDRGFTAAQRLGLLNTAFDAMAAKATFTAGAVATVFQGQGDLLAAKVGQGVGRAVGGSADFLRDLADAKGLDLGGRFKSGFGAGDQSKLREQAEALEGINLGALSGSVATASLDLLRSRGKDPSQGQVTLTQDDRDALAHVAQEQAKAAIEGFDKLPKDVQKYLLTQITANIRNALGDFNGEALNSASIASFLQATLPTAQAAGSEKQLFTGSAVEGSETTLAALQAARQKVLESIPENADPNERKAISQLLQGFDTEIERAEQANIADRVERARALADVEKSRLGLDDRVGRAAVDIATIQGAIANTIDDNARSQLQAQLNDLEKQQEISIFDAAAAGRLGGLDPRAVGAVGRENLNTAIARRGLLTPGSQEFGQNEQQIQQIRQQLRQQQVDLLNAQISASIAGNDSGLVQARGAVQQATNTLGAALRGEADYAQAQAGLRDARRALVLAQLDAADVARRAGRNDLSDPVAQAANDVRTARDRLRADRASGQGRDVLDKDSVDLTNAQLRQDSEKFSQRFNDAQVAEQLGQISHAQYLSYLDSERSRLTDRLAGMKKTDDGYRQAVEQLQQIDQAVAAARDALDSQFNLGDIKVPTPFEVRRFIAATAAGVAQPGGQTTVNQIQIDGTDIATVTAVLTSLLGPGALPTATTASPKG